MILGISSFAFSWAIGVGDKSQLHPMNEIDLVESTVAHGLRCLQIGDNLPLHTFSKERLNGLNSLLEKHAIRLEVGARRLTADNCQRYIQLAALFRSPLLRFVIDGDEYQPELQAISVVFSFQVLQRCFAIHS